MARRNDKNAPISSDSPDLGGGDLDGGSGELETVTPGIDNSAGLDTADSDGSGSGGNVEPARSYTGKKRGRKPGQKSAPRSELAVSVSGLEKILLGIHSGLTVITQNPAWELTKEEAKSLSDASAKVAAHYGASFDPKTADIFVLCGVVGMIYGPRIFMQFTKKKPQQKQPVPANVQSIRPDVAAQAQDMAFNANLPPISGTAMQ